MAATKETIIKMGDELIRKKGFNAFSYHNIAQPLGIKNAAVHYYFPTKTDLLASVIQYHIQKFFEFKKNVENLNELQKVEKFLEIYVDAREQSGVCFVGAMATDWGTVDDAVQPYMQQMANDIINWLTNTLQIGFDIGTLHFAEIPRTKALLIITNMMAATQLARITGQENFETIKQAVINGIKPNKSR
jgi:TetR/AcrR family transcriptional regulator, transcriptional repressor for nem operon